MTTYEEWRVTGEPGEGYPPYEFTFSPVRGESDPEAKARGFVALIGSVGEVWAVGPHLHRRTVTVTEWAEVDA